MRQKEKIRGHPSLAVLTLVPSLQLLDFLAFVSLLACLTHTAFLNHRLFDNLPVEMRQCLDLEVEEGLNGRHVGSSSLHRLPYISEHVSYARLGILKLIFNSLPIQVGKV